MKKDTAHPVMVAVVLFTAGNTIAVGGWYVKQIVTTKLAYRRYLKTRQSMAV